MATSFPGASFDREVGQPPYDSRDTPCHSDELATSTVYSAMSYPELYGLLDRVTPAGESCRVEVSTARVCSPHNTPIAVHTWTVRSGRHIAVGDTPEQAFEKLRVQLVEEASPVFAGLAGRFGGDVR